jgi:hypothetical protein
MPVWKDVGLVGISDACFGALADQFCCGLTVLSEIENPANGRLCVAIDLHKVEM